MTDEEENKLIKRTNTRVRINVDGTVKSIQTSHGTCFLVELPQYDFQNQREIWLNSSELELVEENNEMIPHIESRNKLNNLHKLLYQANQASSEKVGYYPTSVGSILNAYREADISFPQAKELLIKLIQEGECAETICIDKYKHSKVPFSIETTGE